jgi:hypothetical protein
MKLKMREIFFECPNSRKKRKRITPSNAPKKQLVKLAKNSIGQSDTRGKCCGGAI